MLRFVIGLVFLCLTVIATGATTDTSESYDIENDNVHGKCRVWTAVDMLTDEVLHHLECSQETMTDVTSIKVTFQSSGGFVVSLSKGSMLIFDDVVPVAYRIDRGELTRGSWSWSGKSNSASNSIRNRLAWILLDELAEGNRIAIQVADERGHVMLTGSREAVRDFLARSPIPEVAEEERRRVQEEQRRSEEEARRLEEEAHRLGEEGHRRLEEVRSMLEEARSPERAGISLPGEFREWNRIKYSQRPEHFEAFLKSYPNSQFADDALQRLGDLLGK